MCLLRQITRVPDLAMRSIPSVAASENACKVACEWLKQRAGYICSIVIGLNLRLRNYASTKLGNITCQDRIQTAKRISHADGQMATRAVHRRQQTSQSAATLYLDRFSTIELESHPPRSIKTSSELHELQHSIYLTTTNQNAPHAPQRAALCSNILLAVL